METNEKINDLLNQLVRINNDRIEGYEKAAKETEDADLKSLFTSMTSKSHLLKSELGSEITNRGGQPTTATTNSGKVFRAWMDFKVALTGKDRHAILSSCEFGEDVAQNEYKDVLKKTDILPTGLITLIQQQKEKLREDHNRVKELRDSLVHDHH